LAASLTPERVRALSRAAHHSGTPYIAGLLAVAISVWVFNLLTILQRRNWQDLRLFLQGAIVLIEIPLIFWVPAMRTRAERAVVRAVLRDAPASAVGLLAHAVIEGMGLEAGEAFRSAAGRFGEQEASDLTRSDWQSVTSILETPSIWQDLPLAARVLSFSAYEPALKGLDVLAAADIEQDQPFQQQIVRAAADAAAAIRARLAMKKESEGLLRASTAPGTDTERLLRASGAGEEPSEQLLRTVEDPEP
jgi:hypothetical protein